MKYHLPRGAAPTRARASVERIHQVWDELADFDASRVDEALLHAMTALSSLVGAQNAFWLGAVRLGSHNANDPLRGWAAAGDSVSAPVGA